MDLLSDLVHAGDPDKRLDREDLQLLKHILDLTALTSDARAEVTSLEAERSALTDFCTRVKKRLNRNLPNLAPDGSDSFIRSWPSSRPWFGLWYTDKVTKKIWGPRRVYYELSFDTAKRNTLSVSLKCNTGWLADFGVHRDAVDSLKNLSIGRDNHFLVKGHDSGWLEIGKVLRECTPGHWDEVNDDEVENTAREMEKLVRATHNIFDVRSQSNVLRPDKQQPVKRPIPPCKVCGSELKQVTIKDGTTGYRCDKCRKIYKPKSAGKRE